MASTAERQPSSAPARFRVGSWGRGPGFDTMSQIFNRHTNIYSRLSILADRRIRRASSAAWSPCSTCPDTTRTRTMFVEQPIQFSHAHHVGGEGIDCRYCHTSVEESAFANIPPTKTCMNCHSQTLDHRTDSRTGPRQLPRQQAAALDARPRSAGFRVFQPQHPREEGRRLRDLPRARGQDAADVPAGDPADELVPGLPPQSGEVRPAARAGLQHGVGARRRTIPVSARGWCRNTRSRASHS